MPSENKIPRWEHFDHKADIGIRGLAPTLAQAFEQAALALTAVICDPARITSRSSTTIHCEAGDNDYLLLDWINELIYRMAVQKMLFNRFEVSIDAGELTAAVAGEPVDRGKHRPAVEIKGATLTELSVYRRDDGFWVAQCVVDV